MRLGMFMMPVHPPARSFTDTLAEDEEKALYADRLGFEELWLGEHFSASSEPIPSPLMFMASLVPRTKNLTFGTGVICLPNHDPVMVAAEVAQFDHMSRGRFMLGIGPGGLLSDFELFGNADRGVRARQGVELIGANARAIRVAEDRALFADAMRRIGLAVPVGGIAASFDEAEALLERVGFPANSAPYGSRTRSFPGSASVSCRSRSRNPARRSRCR